MIKCFFEDGGGAKSGLRHITVGAIVINEHRQVLLVKRSEKYSRPGKYSVPGGFLNRDQTISSAVLRELKEETGYEGEIIDLFHINDYPDRPHEDRQNVDFIYLVKVTTGKFIENDEVTLIKWFDEKSLPAEEEFAFDHRRTILKAFEYLDKSFKLPLVGEL